MADSQPAGPQPADSQPAGPRPGQPAARPRVVWALAGVAALVIALDAVSKALVVKYLVPGEPVHVWGDILEWTLLRNPGAAFSTGTSYTAVFSVLAIGVIAVVIRIARRLRSTAYAIAFGLLLGGAAGNLGDRLFRAPGVFRGYVVDWIGVAPRYWPVFNLADSAICIAGAMFVLLALLGARMDGTRGERGPAQGAELRGDGEPDAGAPQAQADGASAASGDHGGVSDAADDASDRPAAPGQPSSPAGDQGR